MNNTNSSVLQPISRRLSVKALLAGTAVSFFTWLIACIVTVVSLSVSLVLGVLRAITSLSFKCIVYILLATIFILGIILGVILSIITLGAISLP